VFLVDAERLLLPSEKVKHIITAKTMTDILNRKIDFLTLAVALSSIDRQIVSDASATVLLAMSLIETDLDTSGRRNFNPSFKAEACSSGKYHWYFALP